MEEIIKLAVAGLVAAALIVLIIVLSVKEARALRAKGYSSAEEQNAELMKKATTFADPEERTMTVRVVDLFCKVDTVGYRPARTVREFTVVFEKEDGSLFKLRVDEEAYLAFEKGQRGTLTLLDDTLDSFVLDE